MRAVAPWLLLLATSFAQEPPAPQPVRPPVPQPVPSRAPTAVPSADALQREFEQALRTWIEQNTKARAASDEKELERLRSQRPESAFADRFAAAAAVFAGKEEAVPYLVWLVQRGPERMAKGAMELLMDKHVASPGVRFAVARIGGLKQAFGAEQSLQWLDRVLAKNADAMVLAQAHFTRAAMHVGTRAVATSDELRRSAIEHLKQARTLLAAQPKDEDRSLLGLVDALQDEAERLEPGLPAPEIEGKDLAGVPFKLSDYRGKVVLLDFWGDW